MAKRSGTKDDTAWHQWASKSVDDVYRELYGATPLPDAGFVNEWTRRMARAAGEWAMRAAKSGVTGPK